MGKRKPIALAYAGPNGSGKTTVTRNLPAFGTYINADDIKEKYGLTDIEAAKHADILRNSLLDNNMDFSFETVLSTTRNLSLFEKAKTHGYEIQCIYVLTCDESINIARVKARKAAGGHDVPEEKIHTGYLNCIQIAFGLNPHYENC